MLATLKRAPSELSSYQRKVCLFVSAAPCFSVSCCLLNPPAEACPPRAVADRFS